MDWNKFCEMKYYLFQNIPNVGKPQSPANKFPILLILVR